MEDESFGSDEMVISLKNDLKASQVIFYIYLISNILTLLNLNIYQ